LKEPKLSWLNAFLTSSVGRKYVMGCTGLFLCFFLVVHLSGNLLLFAGDGGAMYNDYAHKLHSNEEFLILAEIGLFAAFALHIYMAFALTFTNRSARKQPYAAKETKVKGRIFNIGGFTPDNTMMVTGLIALAFLIVHVSDFKLELGWDLEGSSRAAKANIVLSQLTRIVLYSLGSIAIGIHVSHGLGSAFQSIGFNHPKYTPTLKKLSLLFGFVVAVGFTSLPIFVSSMKMDAPAIHDSEHPAPPVTDHPAPDDSGG